MKNNRQELYCTKCEKTYINPNPKFKYCPECGGELIRNDPDLLKEFNEIKEKYKRRVCPKCLEEFPEGYNYCPLCSTTIIEDDRFEVDEEKIKLYLKWNEDKVEVNLDDELFTPKNDNEHNILIDLISKYKWKTDSSLENSFIKIGEEIPRKLSYKEMLKIVREYPENKKIYEIKFSNTQPIFTEDSDWGFIEIRKNLYAIIPSPILF